MFTGLIEEVGTISSVRESTAGREIVIKATFNDLSDGESVAVNGVCLTVLDRRNGSFTVAAAGMTIGRTTIGGWKVGERVNLERAMRADSRFGGHIVQGHVDGVATVGSVVPQKDATLVDIELPDGLADDLAPLGSVAIDGVSLTVNALTGNRLQVSLIEYTLNHSALGDLKPGDQVHVETDVIGKHVRRLLAPYHLT